MKVLRVCLVLSLPVLCACAGRQARDAAAALPEPPPKPDEVIIVRSDDPLDYRFHMEQEGRRMNADEFDAWMKSRGVRIATGKPGQAPVPAGGN
ncbi:hypothetical protein EIM48_08385 [Pseudoxanthomonas sp. SGNA-20]|jgi:hypothetical protein|uniref:Lipoprotein n=1 Tax=Pseudoxanthomonas taiwanensis J19 TaxID=935569 RepID=A0A562DLF3_9GAMM|nr:MULTISPECIES: hypothetical protein [Pseudoxanthomonas]RRN56537.1 hypothetical protein EIM48_08385 [Pseudoxanthomonas sp. SGNA-20]RRN79674.1 hypothetical protein EIM50_07015 [Pseudoxanthomonas sp. SGD-10]TWH10491.1 hypothetical protein L613_002400000070 [Pseudoxanthomonas taiwanensis J19]